PFAATSPVGVAVRSSPPSAAFSARTNPRNYPGPAPRRPDSQPPAPNSDCQLPFAWARRISERSVRGKGIALARRRKAESRIRESEDRGWGGGRMGEWARDSRKKTRTRSGVLLADYFQSAGLWMVVPFGSGMAA